MLEDTSGEGKIMGKMRGLPVYVWIQNSQISPTDLIIHHLFYALFACMYIKALTIFLSSSFFKASQCNQLQNYTERPNLGAKW